MILHVALGVTTTLDAWRTRPSTSERIQDDERRKGGIRKGYLTRNNQIAHYLTCPGFWDDSIVKDDRGHWRSRVVGVELDSTGQLKKMSWEDFWN